ncbi:RNA-processing protein, HAT helix [Cynara cardunculus var. scolymus]|uniref:RNA-processing protein, HAT helix n=1 Tax=Cynara cardunculus var. scolymus TaxID=59895 RepID=A0A118JT58_CYNCS|nr:RNA-processing protein, HAT helix [Cynara cardunculus var. scolymus]
MKLSSSQQHFPLFSPSNGTSKLHFTTLIKLSFSHSHLQFSTLPPPDSSSSSATSYPAPPVLRQDVIPVEFGDTESSETEKRTLDELLVVRRPVMESTDDGEYGEEDGVEVEESSFSTSSSSSVIDTELSKFAKKMPIFEPMRVGSSSSGEQPLGVNLDLALYRAKVLARNFRYKEAEETLQKCISYWPEDGRSYVALGKILGKQSKANEARAVYEKGCQATQGENAYIWQCWAVLENRMGNIRRARQLFDAATVADKKHIAAWHGWAILELKVGNVKKARHGLSLRYSRKIIALPDSFLSFTQITKSATRMCDASFLLLNQKAVQASPKNRFAWHVWGVFEANVGNLDQGRKLLKIGHALNPRDPVLLQSLGLLEYKHYSAANLARALFRRAAELDPRHQPVWIAWGWMEWKEGNIKTARELYQRALSINSTSESAARCLQAWGVLEQRIGNLSAARRLFRSSLNINSQSYVTWMTWASLEEDQGNSIRAEEIRNLYFQQNSYNKPQGSSKSEDGSNGSNSDGVGENKIASRSGFNLDGFISEKLSLDASNLDIDLGSNSQNMAGMKNLSPRKVWRPSRNTVSV